MYAKRALRLARSFWITELKGRREKHKPVGEHVFILGVLMGQDYKCTDTDI